MLSLELQDFPGGLLAVHYRHLDVHDDQAVGSIFALAGKVHLLFVHVDGLQAFAGLVADD
jgi:hypothetical protein